MTAIENGASVDARNDMDETLLMRLVTQEVPIGNIKYLIDAGADVNAGGDSWGGTVLMRAVSYHSINFENSKAPDLKLIKLLIDSGADINSTDENGNTVLMYSAYHDEPEIIKFLIGCGASNINAQNNDGETALMRAVKYNSSKSINVLLEAGADIGLKDKKGKCAVDYFSRHNARHEINDDVLKRRLTPDSYNE